MSTTTKPARRSKRGRTMSALHDAVREIIAHDVMVRGATTYARSTLATDQIMKRLSPLLEAAEVMRLYSFSPHYSGERDARTRWDAAVAGIVGSK